MPSPCYSSVQNNDIHSTKREYATDKLCDMARCEPHSFIHSTFILSCLYIYFVSSLTFVQFSEARNLKLKNRRDVRICIGAWVAQHRSKPIETIRNNDE